MQHERTTLTVVPTLEQIMQSRHSPSGDAQKNLVIFGAEHKSSSWADVYEVDWNGGSIWRFRAHIPMSDGWHVEIEVDVNSNTGTHIYSWQEG